MTDMIINLTTGFLTGLFTYYIVAECYKVYKNHKKSAYKLKPDQDGTYTLYRWDTDIYMYTSEAFFISDELHARRVIKLLEKDVAYLE